jgi:hypothetical protein
MQPTTITTSLPRKGGLSIGNGTPVGAVTDSQPEMTRTLDRAEEALGMMELWISAINVIKWVLDVVSPIAEVYQMPFLSHASPGTPSCFAMEHSYFIFSLLARLCYSTFSMTTTSDSKDWENVITHGIHLAFSS